LTRKHLIRNFNHRIGYHCESSAMRDLFEYYVFSMSEAMVFGLDATMGFIFFDKTNRLIAIKENNIPFFIGGKQNTITPNSLACRLLGIILRKQSFSNADKGWLESKKLINEDIPLIIRIDIGYLPFYNFEDEVHFGGHAITLAGYDEDKGIALVGDTTFEEFQEVPIDILKLGRSSEKGDSYMHPKNTQFSMKKHPDGKRPPLSAGVKLALMQVVNHMLRPSVNFNGLAGLKLFANSILRWKDDFEGQFKSSNGNRTISRAKLMFKLIYGYIEEWGTGGACFRNLYKQFLEELLELPDLKKGSHAWRPKEFELLRESIVLIDKSAKKWKLFAETLKEAVIKNGSRCLDAVDFDILRNLVLGIAFKEELLFKKLSKIKI